MFGDMGHGSILLAISLVLVLGNDRLKDTVLAPALAPRYIFMFMGISATYCGFIYNEFFAMQTDIFASCYDIKGERGQFGVAVTEQDGEGSTGVGGDGAFYFRRIDNDCTYPMGTDPIWGIS